MSSAHRIGVISDTHVPSRVSRVPDAVCHPRRYTPSRMSN